MTVTSPSGDVAVRAAAATEVRAAIAACLLADEGSAGAGISERLGSIYLRPHQVDAAARLARLMAENGGALLADEVGLGKTYVALALARDADRTLIAAPAALLPMWESALRRARAQATLVSIEKLSRVGAAGALPVPVDPDLVIVDEAHHVRTPTTRRYAALARLCARSRVLLLSATPLHNSKRDLAAQVALFLGSAAGAMSEDELARYLVRRTRHDVRIEATPPPVVAAPAWVELPRSDDCLEHLLALPPPVPPADGDNGGALLVYSLVRQWASSRAALRAALRRRLARAAALSAALESGRYPTRTELAVWSYADGAVQLAFPELVTARSEDASEGEQIPDRRALLAAVQAHESAARALLRELDGTPDPDLGRAEAIRAIRVEHRGERIIAFAESAETVEAMFRLLRMDRGVATLRARGAAVSGGPLSRREALARFAPVAQGAAEPHASQRIDLLLATDLLSEGVNLQDASVVVHLDLPWNPARLEQRVGRVSRIGSPHARVSVYALRPPAAAERLLEVERRLRAKLMEAGRTIGVVGAILPSLGSAAAPERGAAREWSRALALVRQWRRGEARIDPNAAIVGAVRAPMSGFVAALVGGDGPVVLASLSGTSPSSAPAVVAQAVALAGGADVPVDRRRLAVAIADVGAWISRRGAATLSGLNTLAVARARRRVLARIARVVSRAPRHLRSVVTPLAVDARRAALVPLSEGAERILAELAGAPLADEAWLRAVGAFADLHGRPMPQAPSTSTPEVRLGALLVLIGPEAPDEA